MSSLTSKLAALATLFAVGAGWILYTDVWRKTAARPLAFRDVTPQFRGLQAPRAALRLFQNQVSVDTYIRLTDPGHKLPFPHIDFTREEAVLVAAGPRSSTGYSIEVVRAAEERSRVVITFRERTPTLHDPQRWTVTYPYRLLVFRRRGKPVYLDWQGRP